MNEPPLKHTTASSVEWRSRMKSIRMMTRFVIAAGSICVRRRQQTNIPGAMTTAWRLEVCRKRSRITERYPGRRSLLGRGRLII